jgi:pyruvate dehydrogenase E2 component (dihydrolipoamide acetyltransferase)
MHASLQSMAQLTLVTTADVTEVVAWRSSLDASARPTYTDIVIKAGALALRRHPDINATMQEDQVVLLPDVHVGLATAVPGGLVVPVIKDADRKSLEEIRDEAADLVSRARGGTLGREEMSGGTFTVTSLGGQGIDAFTPIINPPEAAILGVGRIADTPVPATTPVRSDTGVVWRKAITLSLTIDHRVIDGSPGAAFLATIVELLSQPDQLIS